ncbi:hypothetical protein Glove_212g17 [Diversispora epigaea]|uniref:Uncharacterized protein n=1 Tax=Diversispora epigaea TaxID=1348612 RepID=A0A397II61_9GLOM|nr:hypothetical protein Glove_212g17 [Diversispora epigaea]
MYENPIEGNEYTSNIIRNLVFSWFRWFRGAWFSLGTSGGDSDGAGTGGGGNSGSFARGCG